LFGPFYVRAIYCERRLFLSAWRQQSFSERRYFQGLRVYKQAGVLKRERLSYVYTTGKKRIYKWQVEDLTYLKHLKENGVPLKIHLQAWVAESAF